MSSTIFKYGWYLYWNNYSLLTSWFVIAFFPPDVVAIEPEWLPHFLPGSCQFSKPVDDPPPTYDPDTGKVMCHMTSTFGEFLQDD